MKDHDALVEKIRARAFEISQRDDAGTQQENWALAEQEIREQEAAARQAEEAARDEAATILGVARRAAQTHP
jgi:hypothetical protein